MFKKTILTTIAVSVLAIGALGTAHAANNSATIRDHRTNNVARTHRTRSEVIDHRVNHKVRDHRTKRRNEVVIISRKKSCHLGTEKLWWKGFDSVSAYDCKGASYGYRAFKGAGVYNAAMNARTGKLVINFIGIAR